MANFLQSELDALAVKVAEHVLAELEPKLAALVESEIAKLAGKL